MARYPVAHRRRARRTFAAQGDDLARKAVVDIASALSTGALANYFCTRPNPDYFLCKPLVDVANKQAEESRDSLLRLGVWGGLALLFAVAGK